MDPAIVELWADIGSEKYWDALQHKTYNKNQLVPFDEIYVPFGERRPQPGFIGNRYFDSPIRVAVVGQNPGRPNIQWQLDDDKVMLDKIRDHAMERSSESLDALFSVMREFMLGHRPGRTPWGPIRDIQQHIGLKLDDIAYFNMIPLELQKRGFTLKTLREPYKISTKLQIQLLAPHKILFYGKQPHDRFKEWEDGDWDVRYLERIQGRIKIDYKRFDEVKEWLKS